MNKIKRDNGDIVAFLLSALGLTLIFTLCNRFINGQYTMCISDFQAQVIPYLRLFCQKLFSGGSFTYSFAVGLGDDIMADYAAFACFSPFNIVFLLIANDYIAGALLVILKFSFGGFCFYHFCRRVLDCQGLYVSLFAVGYAIGGFSIISYINVQMMDAMYILPLLFITFHSFFKSGHRHQMIICYAYAFIVEFYTSYVIGIFSAFVFVVLMIIKAYGKEGFDFKAFLKGLWQYFIAVCISICLSMVVILPTAYYVLSNMASDASKYMGMQATIFDLIGSLYLGAIRANSTYYPFYYVGLPALICLPFFFISNLGRRSKQIKGFTLVILGFLVLCTLVPFFYLLMHCFDAPDGIGYRFGFLVSFVLSAIGVYAFKNMSVTKLRLCIITASLVFVYVLVYLIGATGSSVDAAVLNIFFIITYTLLIYMKSRGDNRVASGLFVAIFFIELVVNGVLMNANMSRPMISNNAIIGDLTAKQHLLVDNLPNDANEYRLCIKNATPNMSQLYNIHGVGNCFSTFENTSVRELFRQLGYVSSVRVLSDYGSSPLSRAILGQKYSLVLDGITCDTDVETPYIEVNDYCMPIGYGVSNKLLTVNFDMGQALINPFDNQNILASALVGEEMTCYKLAPATITYQTDGLSLYDDNEDIVYLLDEGVDEGRLNILISLEDDADTYVYFPQLVSANYNNVPLLMTLGADEGSLMYPPQSTLPHIMRLEVDSNGNSTAQAYVLRSMDIMGGRISEVLIYEADETVISDFYNRLAPSQLNVTKLKDGYVEGDIEIQSEDQLLFFTIPYDEGWSLYVDGELASIVPVVNDTLMGASISPGTHHIKLVYSNKWVGYGMIISLIGLISFIVILKYES